MEFGLMPRNQRRHLHVRYVSIRVSGELVTTLAVLEAQLRCRLKSHLADKLPRAWVRVNNHPRDPHCAYLDR